MTEALGYSARRRLSLIEFDFEFWHYAGVEYNDTDVLLHVTNGKKITKALRDEIQINTVRERN